MRIVLPWPPSVNRYWRMWRGRMRISEEGRAYRDAVCSLFLARFGDARLRVTIEAYPPDRRRRDIDNLPKCILDSLEKAGVYDDDSQIDDLRIVRCPPKKPGHIVVHIETI